MLEIKSRHMTWGGPICTNALDAKNFKKCNFNCIFGCLHDFSTFCESKFHEFPHYYYSRTYCNVSILSK